MRRGRKIFDMWRRIDRRWTDVLALLLGVWLGAIGVVWVRAGAGPDPEVEMRTLSELGLRVAPGFEVTLYADADLANNITCMALDRRGRVAVVSDGVIKILGDRDEDGVADRVTRFAPVQTGATGICFVGDDLFAAGEGGIWRFRDRDGNGLADEQPENVFPWHGGEFGVHALRQGPDGWIYGIGGNQSLAGGPPPSNPSGVIRSPRGGGLFRFKPEDPSRLEWIAEGFRNPYDFDFNLLGDIFTADGDCEEEALLPAYVQARVYHVETYGDHGWRGRDSACGWPAFADYPDTAEVLGYLGRGAPSGLVFYRHFQFPPYFQQGLFTLDWLTGQVYFWESRGTGTGYRGKPQLFLEPVKFAGFLPTDVLVAMDGALLISTGGRGTRGAIIRVAWENPGENPLPVSEMEAVLNAPDPLEAWSRRNWEPLARLLGAEAFQQVITQEQFHPAGRIRAVEILTERFGGLPMGVAWRGAHDPSPMVRARIAWSVGRIPPRNFWPVMDALLDDDSVFVQRHAVEALIAQAPELHWNPDHLERLAELLDGQDSRLRRGATRLAAQLPEEAWQALTPTSGRRQIAKELALLLARLWRHPDPPTQPQAARQAFDILSYTRNRDQQMEALRLLALALGGFHRNFDGSESQIGFRVPADLMPFSDLIDDFAVLARRRFPTLDPRLNQEWSRLAAMLALADDLFRDKLIQRLGRTAFPSADLHYLIVLTRLPGTVKESQSAEIAHAITALDARLTEVDQWPRPTWRAWLLATVRSLCQKYPLLAKSILLQQDFKRPGNAFLASAMEPDNRRLAARIFLQTVKENAEFSWSPLLVHLLACLPPKEVFPELRRQWGDERLRDALVLAFSADPREEDRLKFLAGLSSPDLAVVRASVRALLALPRDRRVENLVPVMKLLRRLWVEPDALDLRRQIITLIIHQTNAPIKTRETDTSLPALAATYKPVLDWFLADNPQLTRALEMDAQDDPVAWNKLLRQVAWNTGNAETGREVFQNRQCGECHLGPDSLGPPLAGCTEGWAPAAFLETIIFPHRHVPPQYRPMLYQLKNGPAVFGIPVHTSEDFILLRTGPKSVVRLPGNAIAARRRGLFSLMPGGLLDGLSPRELSGLYAFLKEMKPPPSLPRLGQMD